MAKIRWDFAAPLPPVGRSIEPQHFGAMKHRASHFLPAHHSDTPPFRLVRPDIQIYQHQFVDK